MDPGFAELVDQLAPKLERLIGALPLGYGLLPRDYAEGRSLPLRRRQGASIRGAVEQPPSPVPGRHYGALWIKHGRQPLQGRSHADARADLVEHVIDGQRRAVPLRCLAYICAIAFAAPASASLSGIGRVMGGSSRLSRRASPLTGAQRTSQKPSCDPPLIDRRRQIEYSCLACKLERFGAAQPTTPSAPADRYCDDPSAAPAEMKNGSSRRKTSVDQKTTPFKSD